MQRIDLAALDSRIDESNTVDIFPPAAPAYHQLPEQVQKRSQIAVANSEEDAPGARQDIPIEQDSSESSSSESDLSDDDDDAELCYSEDSDFDSLLYEKDGGSDQLLGQQDWDNVSGDLTKRYNRLKQHVGAIHSSQRGAGGAGDVVKPLPAQNQFAQRQRTLQLQAQRRAQHQHAAAASAVSASASSSKSIAATTAAVPGVHASKVDSSLAALSSRYSSSLNLSPLASAQGSHGGITYLEPSFTSNAATRKGGSERHQVSKDKSDRATTEQVLDDRTRLVLYKMLGRGRLERVEGCVSTGKEVSTNEGP